MYNVVVDVIRVALFGSSGFPPVMSATYVYSMHAEPINNAFNRALRLLNSNVMQAYPRICVCVYNPSCQRCAQRRIDDGIKHSSGGITKLS